MIKEIKVPNIGDYHNALVIEVIINKDQVVKKEDILIILEADKANIEIPSPYSGKIKNIKLKEGDKVSQGDSILEIEITSKKKNKDSLNTNDIDKKIENLVYKSKKNKYSSLKEENKIENLEEFYKKDNIIHASPVIRRISRELNINLTKVIPTGRKGRITKKDIQNYQDYYKNNILFSETDFSKFGSVETKPLNRISKIANKNLLKSWKEIPHITFFEEFDITELRDFIRSKKIEAEKNGIKITPLSFIIKAVGKSLLKFPNMNSSLSNDGNYQILKKYIHIGIAVDTKKGLVVPIIRDINQKSIYQIASDIFHMSIKSRSGNLNLQDIQGGNFTISNLGNLGGKYFVPIINQPDVGILGVSKAYIKPVYFKDKLMPRFVLPLSLSVDHRIINGVEAIQFLNTIGAYLSDIRELLL